MCGKQKQLGVTAIAKQAQAKAGAKSKSLDLLASAAKEEAQQARAQKAEKKAAEYARKFADDLYERAMRQRSGREL